MAKAFIDNSDVTGNSKQIELLKKHFPQCFDKHGAFMADKLQEMVGDSGTGFSKESYRLNWLGKSYARLLANENPLTFLSEDKSHNQKPENLNSENLLIKGNNLEVLKHLKQAYAEQVKMIYIDPPYNTGSDGFVYQDDRKFTPNELARLAGIDVDEAQRILDFTQSKANSHSAWLTFMYPRLYVARELLKDDGVIFISIDDNEVAQLRILCDEVFGEENFFSKVIVQSNKRGQTYKQIAKTHEYLLIYTKNIDVDINEIEKDPENNDLNLEDEISAFNIRELRNRNPKFGRHNRPNLYYPFYVSPIKNEDGFNSLSLEKTEKHSIEVFPLNSEMQESCWRWDAKKSKKEINQITSKSNLVAKIKKDGKFNIYEKYRGVTFKAKSIFDEKDFINEQGTIELGKLNLKGVFDFPKPVGLIKKILQLGCDSEDTVLDFFAGSATTAHAVMELNAKNNRQCKFIMIQIAEQCDKKSEAYKAGYQTIFDITQARIEKAAEKIKSETPDYQGDLGFKLFETVPLPDGYLDEVEKLDSPNIDLFDGSLLDKKQLEDLLTTWKVYDGIALTAPLMPIDLAGYTGWQQQKILYLVHKNFRTEALTVLLHKLDDTDDKAFDIERLVIFAHNFDSKHQREISEAMTQYQNRKQKSVNVEFRY